METPQKILKLQIDRPCFKAILKGEQKVEHRFVYPHNANRLVVQGVPLMKMVTMHWL